MAGVAFEVLADGTMRVEIEITSERLGMVTVAAAGTVSLLYIFREPILNALRHPNFPHDEPVIEDIQNGPLIVKLHFLIPGSFLRFYDDYKSGKLEDSLAKEIEKLTTKPTTETATTMTVFDENLPVKFKESLEEKFKNHRFDDKLTVKIRDEEKVKNHAEQLRANTVEPQGRVPCIIVHGGAHALSIERGGEKHEAEVKKGIIQAAERGYEILKQGGSAVDAVEKSVCVMEDNPSFNAGHGASPNRESGVELDAMIMDGSSLKTGAVMSVSCISNPVSLAKRVMEETDHCALSNEGAMDFVKEISFPTTDSVELATTTFSKENYPGEFSDIVAGLFQGCPVPARGEDAHVEGHDSVGAVAMDKNGNCARATSTGRPVRARGEDAHAEGHDSAGAVAMDKNGNCACATSTGGIAKRRKGRISDVPLVGCGGYANEFGASSAGGHGESIIKMTLAREVIYNLERGLSAQESAEKAIDRLKKRIPNAAGAVIVIDQKGNFGKACSTKTMVWATKKGDELRYDFRIPKE